MSVRDLISAAYNKDAAGFESTLHAVMQEKMAAAIQSRFSPAVYEEEVDLEESENTELSDAKKYHEDMESHHNAWSNAHDHEANNVGPRTQEKHSYAETDHANAADAHKKAREVLNSHGVSSPEYKKARNKANEASRDAHESTAQTPKNWVTSGKPTHQTPSIKEEVDQIDEVSGAKLGAYMVKARKSQSAAEKKVDDSFDEPENDS